MLKGDASFTNLESAVAEKGETTHEGRGFLTPPEALDALKALGFNLVALAGNHAFDLNVTGIRNTIREADARKMFMPEREITSRRHQRPAICTRRKARLR